jgi:branched-chain amino acid transport system ATP-binding protein
MSSNDAPLTPLLLEAQSLNVSYGDAPALWDVSFTVAQGELVSIVGPNGAGKTTLVNTLARLQPIRSGTLLYRGEDATRLSAREMCNREVALIPEGRKLWGGMTVEENLDMGSYRKAARPFREQGLDMIYAMFPILKERRWQAAGTLSGGQQQMVAIGRALMARPRLLLIDEPSLGLAPAVVQQVFEVIQDIHASGMSILLIEQNAVRALEVAQRAYVLEGGRIVSTGLPADLMAQPHIREAYLGENAA